MIHHKGCGGEIRMRVAKCALVSRHGEMIPTEPRQGEPPAVLAACHCAACGEVLPLDIESHVEEYAAVADIERQLAAWETSVVASGADLVATYRKMLAMYTHELMNRCASKAGTI